MMNDLKNYDLVVVGGGPAGITAATSASTFGKTVALVDNQKEIGGAGINTGTVPSKTLRETALALSGLKSRNLYGVDLSLRREVTVADFLGHEEHVKDAFHSSITQRLRMLDATTYRGTGAFLDAHTIRVSLGSDDPEKDPAAPGAEIHLRGEKILIAMMCDASAHLFVDACLNLPTLGILYKTATLNALQNVPPSEKHG